MSPKPADPAIRTALLEVAARIIAAEGSSKLTLRRLAQEVGTSTMAIYTHFGGMTELRRQVRREGFARLGAHLGAVEVTGDPVADYLVLGWAYYTNATTYPDLYRAMFMDGPVDAADADAGLDTFAQCVAGAQRCLDGGRFDRADAVDLATQAWALLHGVASLQLAHLLSTEEAVASLRSATLNLFTAFGDDPRSLGRSMERATKRIGGDPPGSHGAPNAARSSPFSTLPAPLRGKPSAKTTDLGTL
jgi:AcrR family transcriptional regulator